MQTIELEAALLLARKRKKEKQRSRLKVLDLGCGQGRHCHGLQYLADQYDYPLQIIGLDINVDDLQFAKTSATLFSASAEYVCGDIHSLPFIEGSFDLVICSEVIEHVPNWQQLLYYCRTLMTQEAVLALSFPTAWIERLCWQLDNHYFQTPGGHIRIMQEDQVTQQATRLELKLVERYRRHALHSPYWWLRCAYSQNESALLVRLYKRFLEWELMNQPKALGRIEKILNPILGKSTSMVFVCD